MGESNADTSEAVGKPTVSLVCSTIGRPTDLVRLLDTLEATPDPSVMEFILVDQSDDKVSTDIRTLREDAAAQTGEDADQRASEAEADESVDRSLRRLTNP